MASIASILDTMIQLGYCCITKMQNDPQGSDGFEKFSFLKPPPTTKEIMDSDQKVQDLCTIVATASRSEGQVIETRLHEHGDRALAFVEEHDAVSFTPQEEKKLLRKIDRVLMPLVGS